ncbi:FkbM family methyltransferase [Acidocella sp.]|uniref:FkbM family methyltransferase n=1 Tax=Acidocella sp. TaxID=50710 RepID=UPI003CFC7D4F
MRFAAGQDTGARILEEAEAGVVIQCLAIDEVFANMSFDYVKLDIEGTECSALGGMSNMIVNYRPRLAVSAYHKPEDWWSIPFKLHSLPPDASIYLRQRCPNTFELVAYAIPQGR